MRRSSVAQRIAWLVLAALLLVNSGCLLAVAGVAAGGAAAAGYVYYHGALSRDYPCNLGDGMAAVRTSLSNLHFPIEGESTGANEAEVTTHTNDGTTIRVHIDVVPPRIPVEAPMTRIAVRVGYTGDEAVSRRVLDEVGRHLVPQASLAPPQPLQTRPPPLAPPAHLEDLAAPARQP
jgi:Protein of unknown function (DUF3568)